MNNSNDPRSPERRLLDEQIAAEPVLSPPSIAPGTKPQPLETLLPSRGRKPLAFAGVVENGLVRPLDTSVKLRENARVIIVASEEP